MKRSLTRVRVLAAGGIVILCLAFVPALSAAAERPSNAGQLLFWCSASTWRESRGGPGKSTSTQRPLKSWDPCPGSSGARPCGLSPNVRTPSCRTSCVPASRRISSSASRRLWRLIPTGQARFRVLRRCRTDAEAHHPPEVIGVASLTVAAGSKLATWTVIREPLRPLKTARPRSALALPKRPSGGLGTGMANRQK